MSELSLFMTGLMQQTGRGCPSRHGRQLAHGHNNTNCHSRAGGNPLNTWMLNRPPLSRGQQSQFAFESIKAIGIVSPRLPNALILS